MAEYPEYGDHGYGISHVHHDDLHSSVLRDRRVAKKFFGETAWSDAERHAGDLAVQRRMKDPDSGWR